MNVSKRFADRAKANLRRYQKVLESARARDVNESDTCVIVSDFLADVLGYDKYSELTTEYAIRSTFCDLALKLNGRVQFLIEVKSAGTDLKENHLRQACDYAAKEGIEWVLLTNGVTWKAHRLRFEQPVRNEEVFEIDLLDPTAKPAQLIERLYLISREGASSTAIADYWQHKEATSRYVIAQLLLDLSVVGPVRRLLRNQFPGLRISEEELVDLLRNEVIKRDALEGEKAAAAQRLIRRAAKKREKGKGAGQVPAELTPEVLPTQPAIPS